MPFLIARILKRVRAVRAGSSAALFIALVSLSSGAALAIPIDSMTGLTDGLPSESFTASGFDYTSTAPKAADNSTAIPNVWQIDFPAYQATVADPHWVRIDLGASYSVETINILSYDNGQGTRLRGFTVEGGADGSTWAFSSPAFTYANSGSVWQQYTFTSPTAYRYWRVAISSTYDYYVANGRYMIKEMELFGSPVPEPVGLSLAVLGAGAALLGGARRRRCRAAA